MSKHRDGAVGDLKVDETLNLTFGETVELDVVQAGKVERVAITLEEKSGRVARLRVRAARDVVLHWPTKKPALAG